MDPVDVFRSSEILKFWPTASQTSRQRVSASTRFILYAICLVYVLTRDKRVLVIGAVALAVLFYLWKSGMVSEKLSEDQPTADNPMGNVLLTDYMDDPNRPAAAWYPSVRDKVQRIFSKIHPFERQRDAERNFYTAPSSTIPNDQTGFAWAAFGKPFAPKCHDQGGAACDPDRFYSTFPEEVQLRGGNGGGYGSSKA
jgi:hypothetical protein